MIITYSKKKHTQTLAAQLIYILVYTHAKGQQFLCFANFVSSKSMAEESTESELFEHCSNIKISTFLMVLGRGAYACFATPSQTVRMVLISLEDPLLDTHLFFDFLGIPIK